MPEPQVECCAAGPVHDERKQDDGHDYHDHPEEEHDDAGNGITRYSSRSSHGRQLPTAVRFIRLAHRLPGTKRARPATSGTLQARGQTRMPGAIAGAAGLRPAVSARHNLKPPGMHLTQCCLYATSFSGMAALCMPRDKSLRRLKTYVRSGNARCSACQRVSARVWSALSSTTGSGAHSSGSWRLRGGEVGCPASVCFSLRSRSQPIAAALSDGGRRVRSTDERPATRAPPRPREMT
jgi:hypothetical protein